MAAASVAAVSLGFVRQEPYPYRLFIPEAVMPVAALTAASHNGVEQVVGFVLSLVGIYGSFSAMFLSPHRRWNALGVARAAEWRLSNV